MKIARVVPENKYRGMAPNKSTHFSVGSYNSRNTLFVFVLVVENTCVIFNDIGGDN